MKSLPVTSEFLQVARRVRRVVWFKEPEEALSDPVHFLAHVMTYGTSEDLKTLQGVVGIDEFREVLANAPPVFLMRGHGLFGIFSMAGRFIFRFLSGKG